MALLSASAIAAGSISIGLAALPANAATTHPTTTMSPDAIGAIVCSGDLCIQSDSCNSDQTEVSIDAWADTGSFFGHFELENPNGADYNSTPNENWLAGGTGNEFTVPLFTGEEYHVIAWKYTPSSATYTNIGQVNFTVNNC
jgi:hypothetical protein